MNAEMFFRKESRTLDSADAAFWPFDTGQKQRPKLIDQILQCLVVATLAVMSYLFVTHYFFESVEIVGVSMKPTLQPSERFLLTRWTYLFNNPQPGDIVVIQDPTDNTFAIKRIIAACGDSVCLKDGSVFINGHKLQEPYLTPGTPTFPYENAKEEHIVCGNNRYFVMGDNRMNSLDSRAYGAIKRQNILGLVMPEALFNDPTQTLFCSVMMFAHARGVKKHCFRVFIALNLNHQSAGNLQF